MTAEPSPWLAVIIIVAFPLVFVAIWSFVCATLAAASGYRRLVSRFAEGDSAANAEALPSPFAIRIGLVSYRGGIAHFDASPSGLGVQISSLFPFHPALRVPWELVSVEDRRVRLDDSVTLYVSSELAGAIAERRARFQPPAGSASGSSTSTGR